VLFQQRAGISNQSLGVTPAVAGQHAFHRLFAFTQESN
jgi:hypothetical protein